MRNIILYHKDCMDGLASATVIYNMCCLDGNKDVISIPIQYGNYEIDNIIDQLDQSGEDVIYIVDFSLKRDETIKLSQVAKKIIIIDHHQTAEQELIGLDDEYDNIEINFDMEKSGASLCLEYMKNKEYPLNKTFIEIIKYVEDRDLWKWKLDNSKEVSEFLRFKVKPNDIDSFKDVISKYEINDMIEFGKILVEKVEMQSDAKSKIKNLKEVIIEGTKFLITNATENISEIGNKICLEHTIPACMYFILPNNDVVLSFRSTDEIGSVNQIAKSLGGGGHPNACGATVSLKQLVNILGE